MRPASVLAASCLPTKTSKRVVSCPISRIIKDTYSLQRLLPDGRPSAVLVDEGDARVSIPGHDERLRRRFQVGGVGSGGTVTLYNPRVAPDPHHISWLDERSTATPIVDVPEKTAVGRLPVPHSFFFWWRLRTIGGGSEKHSRFLRIVSFAFKKRLF